MAAFRICVSFGGHRASGRGGHKAGRSACAHLGHGRGAPDTNQRIPAPGNVIPDISWGAESIIRQQCQDLQFIQTALRDQFDAMREAKLKVRNIHEVARQAGVPVEVAEICVFVATGIPVRVNGKLPPDTCNG